MAVLGASAVHLSLGFFLDQHEAIHLGQGGRELPRVVRAHRAMTVSRMLPPLSAPVSDAAQGLASPEDAAQAPLPEPARPPDPVVARPEEESAPIITPEQAARLENSAEAALRKSFYAGFPADQYIEASRLTVRPQVRDVVQLPWPEGVLVPPGVVYAGRFRLFIDEAGHVRRIEGEGGTLLPVMIEQTQSAFLGARFAPGELDGQQVRSWIRIEVEYDARGVVYTRTLN